MEKEVNAIKEAEIRQENSARNPAIHFVMGQSKKSMTSMEIAVIKLIACNTKRYNQLNDNSQKCDYEENSVKWNIRARPKNRRKKKKTDSGDLCKIEGIEL